MARAGVEPTTFPYEECNPNEHCQSTKFTETIFNVLPLHHLAKFYKSGPNQRIPFSVCSQKQPRLSRRSMRL